MNFPYQPKKCNIDVASTEVKQFGFLRKSGVCRKKTELVEQNDERELSHHFIPSILGQRRWIQRVSRSASGGNNRKILPPISLECLKHSNQKCPQELKTPIRLPDLETPLRNTSEAYPEAQETWSAHAIQEARNKVLQKYQRMTVFRDYNLAKEEFDFDDRYQHWLLANCLFEDGDNNSRITHPSFQRSSPYWSSLGGENSKSHISDVAVLPPVFGVTK